MISLSATTPSPLAVPFYSPNLRHGSLVGYRQHATTEEQSSQAPSSKYTISHLTHHVQADKSGVMIKQA